MVDITIPNVPDAVAERLQALAQRRGVSIEDAARDALAASVRADLSALASEAARLRAMTLRPSANDSADILAQIRQTRGADLLGD
jgi:plasmid stability protein